MTGFPEQFLAIFNNYLQIPGLDDGEIKMSALIFGALACIAFILYTVLGDINKRKKGYKTEKMSSIVIRLVALCVVVMAVMWKLSQYKGVPFILLWLIGIVAIYAYITSKTTFGRHFYALGGNEKATKLSGINTNRIYFAAYVNMSFLSAFAALVVAARFTSANPAAGTNYELDAIGSCFIGGASAYGGIGKVSGVVVGAVLMGVLNLGMNIIGVDSNFQKVVKGLVLLAAVIFDVVSKRRAVKSFA